ncbi:MULTISPECIES: V-type ATP synthase subunit E [unclassified Meiothermus]|uniref:V-type ATP synthase subunit E n=1 Tax=unclassified Meiothermus TaxID=370471 RepID=UPI000D7BC9A1|nr:MULTISPECIES: V-type ATP synthase subunit E [unclassified Meiothermus]PZA08794.1 V-type ATP synthase subunit E [Meiothermus sp. Pnk-1]RYM40584.1 V-type ATP synthase subunit E [Meiothermus sp. PNK-Is4]
MSKLEDILKQEVSSEIASITAEAEAKARAIVEEAQGRAEALKASRLKALEVERQAALRRAESAAELVVNQARIRSRGQIVDQVKAGVRQALAALPSQPDYPAILAKLAEEALRGVDKPEALVVNPADAPHLESWAKDKGLELRTDPSVRLGVRLTSAGEKFYVENTLAERLERSWEALSAKAVKAIWG